ncbi:PLP-dependent aminotransferase family protein [Arthrobacter sp. NPDC056727]|uniref:aminotransferase-like domain-containing protein n=1 Tax=Arthrobacter sp. NPDC056727 TaxID=3345927 RepID=UPI00366DD743
MNAEVLPWAARTKGLVGSIIDSSTSLLQRQTHDIVSFAMGSPAAEAVPSEDFSEIYSSVLANNGAGVFAYGATEGETALRDELLAYLETTPERTSAERLLITSGGMQGLDLAGKLFVDPGDLVIVEAPTYTNGSATLLAYGADIVEAPIDDDGLIVETLPELVQKAGRRPKAIYVIPNFQNPTGTAMSLKRRLLLLALAREWRSIIIDDDPYGMLRFDGRHIPGFRELGGGDPLVFSVRTFSKILAPGLRVGWVDADPAIVEKLIDAKQTMDTCTNVPNQLLSAEFLRRGGLEPHLDRLRREYQKRMRAMQTSLENHFSGVATWTHPQGGFFLWLTFGDNVDTSKLFDVAVQNGVAFIPGRAFSVTGQFGNALRLCFASQTPERTELGISRLAEALKAL